MNYQWRSFSLCSPLLKFRLSIHEQSQSEV
jgi:hypothetical protein